MLKDFDVEDILKVSSNIGTAKIALMMGDQRLYEGLKAFEFGERLDVGLPGEEAGIFIQRTIGLKLVRLGLEWVKGLVLQHFKYFR